MKHYSHRILSPFGGKIIVTFLIVIMSIGICRAQYAGLKIHYLGANHSLVQVQEPQKYLCCRWKRLLPRLLSMYW